MKRKRPYTPAAPVVLVVWIDAMFSHESHWTPGTQPERPKKKDHICVTTGWLTHMDEAWVQITQTITDGSHAHTANIPRGMVQSITILEPVGSVGDL